MIESCTILIFWVLLPFSSSAPDLQADPQQQRDSDRHLCRPEDQKRAAPSPPIGGVRRHLRAGRQGLRCGRASNRSAWTINGSFKLVDENGATWHPTWTSSARSRSGCSRTCIPSRTTPFTIIVPEETRAGCRRSISTPTRADRAAEAGAHGPRQEDRRDRRDRRAASSCAHAQERIGRRRVQTIRLTQ